MGARVDQDDVLFLLPDAPKPLVVVHLAYSSAPDDDPTSPDKLPRTTFYSSLEDWLSRGMAADHEDNVSGTSEQDE